MWLFTLLFKVISLIFLHNYFILKASIKIKYTTVNRIKKFGVSTPLNQMNFKDIDTVIALKHQ